jgi:hypothetical protein
MAIGCAVGRLLFAAIRRTTRWPGDVTAFAGRTVWEAGSGSPCANPQISMVDSIAKLVIRSLERISGIAFSCPIQRMDTLPSAMRHFIFAGRMAAMELRHDRPANSLSLR